MHFKLESPIVAFPSPNKLMHPTCSSYTLLQPNFYVSSVSGSNGRIDSITASNLNFELIQI